MSKNQRFEAGASKLPGAGADSGATTLRAGATKNIAELLLKIQLILNLTFIVNNFLAGPKAFKEIFPPIFPCKAFQNE